MIQRLWFIKNVRVLYRPGEYSFFNFSGVKNYLMTRAAKHLRLVPQDTKILYSDKIQNFLKLNTQGSGCILLSACKIVLNKINIALRRLYII